MVRWIKNVLGIVDLGIENVYGSKREVLFAM